MSRCPWAEGSELERAYHDLEWGVPVHDDRRLFEFLVLESAQAGLSWITILRKREAYREAYRNFEVEQVAGFGQAQIEALLRNPGIVRNRLKIESSVQNAQAFIRVQREFNSFAEYLWNLVDGAPIQNHWRSPEQVPAQTPLSQSLSRDLKARGFRFVGPTICYAYMQAVGLVNDHLTSCRCYRRCTD